jgi:hypothetical protein
MIKSRDQIGFDSTAADASTGCCMTFDPTFASASGNVVLTISARHARRRLFELPFPLSFLILPPSRRVILARKAAQSARVIPNFSKNHAAEEVPSMACLEYDKEAL